MAIVDPTRITDWTYCGVPGGIPTRSTIFASLTSSDSLATINTAIDNCPSGQVVYLAAGTYNLNGAIKFDSNTGVTLRGAGETTILNFTHTGSACIDSDDYGWTGAAAISSGYTQGSTAVVMSGTPNAAIVAGMLIRIDQNDDTTLVFTGGSPARRMRFVHRVTSVSGNTINFTPPLAYALTAGLSPQVSYLSGSTSSISQCGIEDLKIQNTGVSNSVIYWIAADRSWVKNVRITKTGSQGIQLIGSVQCEIRKVWFDDGDSYPSQPDCFAVYLYDNATWNLVEDCIFDECGCGTLLTGASCNAVLFNYYARITFNDWPYQTGGINSNHGAYPLMNLFEGNVTEMFQCDGYHGSAGYGTLFRNWFSGVSLRGVTGNRKCVSLERGSYYFNLVGNVLGCSWGADAWSGPGTFQYEMTGDPGYTDAAVIYRLGYPNVGNNSLDNGDVSVPWPLLPGPTWPDPEVENSIYRHGNYDTQTSSIIWDAGNADHDIPDSLMESSKPEYFGICPWPPFDPADPTASDVTNIPAGYRYVNGVDPPPSGDTVLNTTNLNTTNLVIG